MKPGVIKTILRFFCLMLCLILVQFVYSQRPNSGIKADVYFMFYNVENLFDLLDDEMTRDDEFAEGNEKNWNEHKLVKKIRSIYKVIISAGNWNPPAFIALAEVENREVLLKLLNQTPLKELDYGIIHFDSPDERGIDLALLYRKSVFQTSHQQAIEIGFPFDSSNKTRDILYVAGKIDQDTMHVFINHWPSRFGGTMASEPYRSYLSQVLCQQIDSIIIRNPNARIIICGDFNDELGNNSLQELLTCTERKIHPLNPAITKKIPGSIKFQQKWYIFDMFMVSEALLDTSSVMYADKTYQIIAEDFMLLEDSRGYGVKPFRTYNGPHYIGGCSDHLPVLMILHRAIEYGGN